MNDDTVQDAPSGGMTLADIYFVLFRQKWKILFFCALGIVGAVAALALRPPLYRSDTRLFIRYVVAGKSPNAPGSEAPTRPLNDQEQSIINTEIEILKSFDLARQVAEAIGPEKILAKMGGGTNLDFAANRVMKNLLVEAPARGSVIPISFQHPDPQIARAVLERALTVYYKKHADAHQMVGIPDDLLTQETNRLRGQLAQTEQQLRAAKTNAGVTTTVGEAKKAYTDQIAKTTENLLTAEADLAEHQAALEEAGRLAPAGADSAGPGLIIPSDVLIKYRSICRRLTYLSEKEQELLTQYTEKSVPVIAWRTQMAEIEITKVQLEKQYPDLLRLDVPAAAPVTQAAGSRAALSAEAIQVRGLKSKVDVLKAQLKQIQSEAARLDELEPTIQELQSQKEREEKDLNYFLASLEQARLDAALGKGQAPGNIGIIDPPTPPIKARPKSFKKTLVLVGLGPIAAGLALAFFIEMFLDRSVKRPGEVETRLGLPLFISIPAVGGNGKGRSGRQTVPLLPQQGSQTTGPGDPALLPRSGMELVRWDARHNLNPFYGALRDRLIAHFEDQNLTRKPKLVAVTGCAGGAGVSTIAAGLAASLSETGDGNVLLVDMQPAHETAHYFHKGSLEAGLDAALEREKRSDTFVQENLYLVTEATGDDKVASLLPKRFTQLVPRLKASDYDYIIFDMPPVNTVSVTPRLARFMDMNLLVVESEKTDREVVKRAGDMLSGTKPNIGVVLNKQKSYVPSWLQQEF